MEIFYSGETVNVEGSVVALGNFDGLHIAHMMIINNCIDFAKSRGLKSGVLLFDHHSTEVTRSRNVSLIMPNENKIEILEKTGIDFVYLRKFDKEFMERTPLEFVRFLRSCLKIRGICVGYDYRFGHKAKGDTELLKKLGTIYGFEVSVAECVTDGGYIVGSTLIRKLINNGEVKKAAHLLGRNFFVDGIVVEGLQNGRKMGYPTANVDFDPRMAIPSDGVYAGYTYIDSVRYKSVINIGNNPTFDGKKITLESHIIDFDADIYTKYIRVEFVRRIRGEKKFSGMDELKAQISSDMKKAEEILL